MAETLEQLETKRAAVLRALAETGDMRQDSITETYRRCGKQRYACAAAYLALCALLGGARVELGRCRRAVPPQDGQRPTR